MLFAAGVALRVVVQLAYRPAIIYIDSFGYLQNTDLGVVGGNPIGYDVLLLEPLLHVHDLAVIPLVQHLLGLAMAAGLYLLLLRRTGRAWLAALATAPVLLDAYQLEIEQNVLAETLFQALVVGGAALLTWRASSGRPVGTTAALAAVAGALFGLAATVRAVGQPLVAAGAVYLLLVLAGWWRSSGRGGRRALVGGASVLLALVTAFAAPLVAYGAWYQHEEGEFRVSAPVAQRNAYGRVGPVADCSLFTGRPDLAALCSNLPPSERRAAGEGVDWFINANDAPAQVYKKAHRLDALGVAPLQGEFARVVWRHQPLAVAQAVLVDFAKGFAWTRTTSPGDVALDRWYFPDTAHAFDSRSDSTARTVARFGGSGPAVSPGLVRFLQAYQSVVYTRGPLLAAAGVLGLLAAVGVGRARRSGLRSAALLFVLTGAGLLLGAATFEFSWRYQLPALVLLPPAGALGLAALLGPPRKDPTREHSPDPR